MQGMHTSNRTTSSTGFAHSTWCESIWATRKFLPQTQITRVAISSDRGGGFTLIEVLVSLLLVTISMLGAASLLNEGIRVDRDSFYRTLATAFASDMASRMRSNPTGAEKGYYNKPAEKVDVTRGCSDPDKPCLSRNLANYDLAHWGDAIRAELPNGTGQIISTRSEQIQEFVIQVSWGSNGSTENSTRRCINDTDCLTLVVGI